MTFEPWKEDSILVRFEHILEENEDPLYSKSVKINLKDVFHTIPFDGFLETNLAANQWIKDVNRFKFTSAENDPKSNSLEPGSGDGIELIFNSRSGRGIPVPPMPNLNIDDVYVNNWSGMTDKMMAMKRGRSAVMPKQEDFDVTLKPMEIRTFVLYKEN